VEGKRLLRSIRLTNLLSCGPEMEAFRLEPLNVLIGINASGKSNLIEALALLAAAPQDLALPIRQGGGIGEWLWKGSQRPPVAVIETVLDGPGPDREPLCYRLALAERGHRFELVDEVLARGSFPEGLDAWIPDTELSERPRTLYAFRGGQPILAGNGEGKWRRMALDLDRVAADKSILAQRRDVDRYPELTHVAAQLAEIRFFREGILGRRTAPRGPQQVDLPEDFLLEDASNLWLVLANLISEPAMKDLFLDRLRAVYGQLEDIRVKIQGGTVQVFFHEEGLFRPIPGSRLSDGMLRFLCLLTILHHPHPPPLVALEEPDLGLHPDTVSLLGEALLEASKRTQLVVTTHSSTLVSALSDFPEAVVVTERDVGGTRFRRLDAEALGVWLDRYQLGEIWQMGELGGNRW
jgi:predicted ATPase